MKDRPAGLLPFLVGSAALALYAALPSLRHNFDGVACAIAVELGDFRHLVHGNHLAYGLTGFAFHRLLHAFGLALPALWALQILDSLLGALSAALFADLLLKRGRPVGVACAAALGLAVSNAWWLRSIDAQVYLLAQPFLVLALKEALSDRPRAGRLALFHVAAMLVHSSHALFAPAAAWALLRGRADSEQARQDLGRYLVLCVVGVVAAYAAAVTLCVRPDGMAGLKLWLLGSAGLGPGRTPLWLTGATEWENLRHWAWSSLRVVCEKPWLGLGLWVLAGWSWLTRSTERERPVAFLWLGSYALLFVHWEPWNLDYRIGDLLPLWASAAAAVSPDRARQGARGLALFVGMLGAVNASWAIIPVSRLSGNLPLVKTLWLRDALPPDAWVTALSIEEVYIPYFAHRRVINLRWHEGRPEGLGARLEALLESGEPVFVTSDHLERGWEAAFAPFPREEAGRRDGTVLYRLKGKPKGSL
ncbi:MAG: hypothetical protein HY928_15035 [Elusimicrobia bacterium]|nr:hypothetical protein [Elusimicrobiota bacterium]